MFKIGKSIDITGGLGMGNRGRDGWMPKECGIPFQNDETILKSLAMMVAQLECKPLNCQV